MHVSLTLQPGSLDKE